MQKKTHQTSNILGSLHSAHSRVYCLCKPGLMREISLPLVASSLQTKNQLIFIFANSFSGCSLFTQTNSNVRSDKNGLAVKNDTKDDDFQRTRQMTESLARANR